MSHTYNVTTPPPTASSSLQRPFSDDLPSLVGSSQFSPPSPLKPLGISGTRFLPVTKLAVSEKRKKVNKLIHRRQTSPPVPPYIYMET